MNETFLDVNFWTDNKKVISQECEMGLVCGTYGREDRFVEVFGGKLGRDNFEGLRVDGGNRANRKTCLK